MEKINSLFKLILIIVFLILGSLGVFIEIKVLGILDDTNKIIQGVDPIVKKSDKIVDDIYKISDKFDNIGPILEKSNKLLDTANSSMSTINKTVLDMKPMLDKTSKLVNLANKNLKQIQPTIKLLTDATKSVNGSLGKLIIYIKKINDILSSFSSKGKGVGGFGF